MKKQQGMRLVVEAVAVLLLAGHASSGCDFLEKRKIERVLDERARAVESGDAQAYLSFFAPDYEDEWIPFDQLRAKAIQRLAQKPLPKISFGKRQILIKGDKAVVTEHFTLEDQVKGRARRYDQVQHPFLVHHARGWQCKRWSEVLRLLGGRMDEEHEIEQTLLRREAALVKEDLGAYMNLVSSRYHGPEGLKELRDKLIRIFQVYDDVQFRSFDRKIWFHGDFATVRQRFNMNVMQLDTPKTFTGKEKFELEKTGEEWKFIKGL